MDYVIRVLEREIREQKQIMYHHGMMIDVGHNVKIHGKFIDACEVKIKNLETAIEKLKKETTDGLGD